MRKYLFSMLMWCAGISLFAAPWGSKNGVSTQSNWDETSMNWQPMQEYGFFSILAYCVPTATSNDANPAPCGAQSYSEAEDYTITVEEEVGPTGCLAAVNGQWPSATFTPTCSALHQTIVTNAFASEFSKVNVIAGNTYTFRSSVATDFVTISNEAGTITYAAGVGPLTWTAATSEVIRYYLHTDAACGAQSTNRTKSIMCGTAPAEPDYACDQAYAGVFNLASSVNAAGNFALANDFFVPMDVDAFNLKSVKFLMVIPSATSTTADFGAFDIAILNDNASTPGTAVETFADLIPSSVELHSEVFATFKTFYVTFEIPDGGYELPVNAAADTRYWISASGVTTTAQNVFVVGQQRYDSYVSAPNFSSPNLGTTWAPVATASTNGTFDSNWSFDADCEAAGPDGCLEAENGQWPSSTFVPACLGTPEVVTANGWTGEYSMVTVTSGTEYVFTVSDPTYFITIGDATGTTVLTSGTGSVTWTATLDGNIRYYTHFNSDCEWDDETFLERHIQCGEPIVIEEPDFECFQGDGLASNGPEDGLNISPLTAFRNADDFIVADGTSFTVQQVRMNILSATEITNLTLNFRADNAGSPGAVEETVTMAPSSQRIVGAAFGFNVYEVTMDLATALEFGAGTYWLQPEATNQAGTGAIYWEMSTTGTNGAISQTSEDSGATWTANEFGYNAIFFVAGECDTVVAEGCLEAENGQWPSSTFVPACLGMPEVVTANAWTGEYSMVTVTSGTEYIFTVSDPTYFITIGDETGTTVLTSGTGSVTWTATLDGNVRYYTHFNTDCEWDDETFLERHIQCGDPIVIEEPDFPCFQGDGLASNGPEDGLNISPNTDFRNADDFIVAGTFNVQQVRMNILSTSEITEVTLNFRADDAGSPGAVEETVTMAPSSQRIVGAAFGFNVYEVTMDLATALDFTAGTYWLQPEAYNEDPTDGAIYWEMSTTGTNGEISQTSEDAGASWTANEFGYNAIFFISGECALDPGEECNQEVLSNSLENGLFLGGVDNQRLAIDITVDAGSEMTISAIEPTIIVPEGSEATTFSFIFYADEAGLPGAEVDNATGTIISSNVTGQNFGRDFIRYVLDLDADVVLEAGTYWMEMTSDAEGWEATTADVLGSTLVFSNTGTSGAWTVDGTGTELVYELVATCTTMGISDMDSYDFAYYPNPVKDELNITSQKLVQSVSVYNLAGQQISTQKLNVTNGKVSTSALTPGVYVFRAVLEGGQVETFKIIKK